MARVDWSGVDQSEWSAAEWDRVWGCLTADQRRVVELVVFDGLSLAAAGGRLGLTRGAAAGAWRRGLARIRAALPADG